MRRFVLLAALVAAGCTSVAAPYIPFGAYSWTPDKHVADSLYYTDTDCAGYDPVHPKIDWYLVPGRSFSTDIGVVAGYFDGDHSIYIADAEFVTTDYNARYAIMEHELIHLILRYQRGDSDPQHLWPSWALCREAGLRV